MTPAAVCVAMLIATTHLACSTKDASTSGTPTPTASPSPLPAATPTLAAWPNEPPGMTVLTDWAMDQAVPGSGDVPIGGSLGWRVVHEVTSGSTRGRAEQGRDATAPFSPPNVYDFIFPAGMLEGYAPATVYYPFDAREVYVGFWWKPSSPFDLGPNGNKIAFLFNGGGSTGGQQFLILRRDGLLHVLPEYRGDFRWRTPNVNATPVALGSWHLIEWYAQLSNGTLRWWLDGVVQGQYDDVRNATAFDMFQLSPTFGGNTGARKRQTDHYWFDHLRLSIR